MAHRDIQPQSTLSLSETHVGGICFSLPGESRVGRGCLLQIYPARVDSDIIRLDTAQTLIGRDTMCDVVLEDNAVSRHHALIESHTDGYLLRDLESTNGTFIDDHAIAGDFRLLGGELIRAGGTILKFMSSIDEEVQYHAVVRQLMTRDTLTNAYNRSYLLPMLQKSIERAVPHGRPVSLIMMDIDFFKRINDRHGHVIGDEVLRVFAERIRSRLHHNELFARFGGEEFVVVAEDADDRAGILLAEALRQAVASEPFDTQVGCLNVTCSFGVVCSDKVRPTSVDQFLSAVDTALYSAKNSGRNLVRRR